MTRPSPLAIEASAVSSTARSSARVRSRSSHFPKDERFLHRVFFAMQSTRLDGLASEGFLVGGELNFHNESVGVTGKVVKPEVCPKYSSAHAIFP